MKIKKFKTSQWILVIIIMFLGQLLLHYYSSQVMSGSEVINYFSFAGTIVSIILAVLAIIYSFYQSFTQQNNVDLISREVGKLKKTSKDINKSSENISNAADVLPKILLELESLPSLLDSTVASQIKKQTGELLIDHATDLKSFMTDSMSRSLTSLVNESSKIRANGNDENQSSSEFEGIELIALIIALAAYRILKEPDVAKLYSIFEKYLGVENEMAFNAVLSGSTSVIIAFIMAGDLTQVKDVGLKIRGDANELSRITRFVNYAFSELKEVWNHDDSVVSRMYNEIFDLPSDEDEVVKMLSLKVVGK
ncbi:hypothetical protein OKT24_12575 [Aeromonas veronii]|nr:hypothetical protein [Aeromonas veronii]